jgi:hypothetical protein
MQTRQNRTVLNDGKATTTMVKRSGCLSCAELFSAAAKKVAARVDVDDVDVRSHLENCQRCSQEVEAIADRLSPLRQWFNDSATSACEISGLALDRHLGDRAPSGLSSLARRWLAYPVPAYVAVGLLFLVGIVAFPGSHRRPAVGEQKEVNFGVAAADLFAALYSPNLQDAGRLVATARLLEQYWKSHPDDVSVNIKLISIYSALLLRSGWEQEGFTRESVRERIEFHRQRAREKLSSIVGTAVVSDGQPEGEKAR